LSKGSWLYASSVQIEESIQRKAEIGLKWIGKFYEHFVNVGRVCGEAYFQEEKTDAHKKRPPMAVFFLGMTEPLCDSRILQWALPVSLELSLQKL
jgi:hypothetical protein